ncbi:MAG TPA: hypothetical protein VLM40_13750 [Gemmata sp.]|nr:hypothetical protein [Gemmata sp.]
MPTATIPISRRVVDHDPAGPIRTLLQASLRGQVEASNGVRVPVPKFVIDTGSMYTMASATWARTYGIPIPDHTSRLPLRTVGGTREVTVRDGELRVRFPYFAGRLFRLYCLFSEDYSPSAPPLLGLNNFIDLFRVSFDGRYTHDAPAGHVRLETD